MMVYELKNIIFFIPIIRNIQHLSAAHKEIYVFAMISKMVDIFQTFTLLYVVNTQFQVLFLSPNALF